MAHENIYYLLPLVYTCEYVYIYHAYVYRKSLFLLLCCHTKRVSVIHSGFGYPRVRFWGRIITRTDVRCGFGFRFRVSGSGAQRLHPIRICPIDIPSAERENVGQRRYRLKGSNLTVYLNGEAPFWLTGGPTNGFAVWTSH